jgi:protocatechuate 3,4-dioxygenase beta subunit
LTRRQAFGVHGTAAAAAAAGPRTAAALGIADAARLLELDCVVTPEQTEGPYFVDERLLRADIRTDPETGAARDGSPLELRLAVSRVDGAACTPIEGALVDVWQCDALGVYSDVRDFQGLFDTRGQKFLRGYQLTDAGGAARFVTVYPGWYSGRAVHIHFKIRLVNGDRTTHELTSQLYFDDAITDQVHALAPYNAKGMRDVRNERDGIFRRGDSGSRLLLRLTREGEGYVGELAVGLRMS